MTNRQLDEERIFHVARQIPAAEARNEYLDQICAGDQALRERVEALLEVHEKEEDFLKSSPEPAPTVDQPTISEGPGHQIGRYKLLQKIGEGGFGVVYMAEQQRPVRRKVALKIIKPGMDTHAVVARFEAERQALALMDHPNISRVLDGGATESGRPYFVMELVKGIPITDYSDKNQLSTQDRLKLFITVCQAVQHAHQKGIIHRDLKPSNILITLADGQPVVKVIDFGVSKALNQQLTEKTLFTAYGQMIGTPQYMSPEQAEMSCLDVDTRSDVYSLGVLLYELLTGTTPLEGERLHSAGYAEMQRIIREEEPPKPSTRLSTAGETLTIIAKHRDASPERLRKTVRGDLDWIVMKALEKDRGRRYETPSSLADDVQRVLNHEPVEACPPSHGYRLYKFIRRNRALIAATSVVALTLVAATVTSTWFAWQMKTARDRADELATESAKLAAEADNERSRVIKTLRAWRHELVDRGIEASLRGDLTATHEIIEKAEEAEVPGEWLLLLEGLAHNFSDDSVRAGALLKQAHQVAPENLAVVASLLMTRSSEGSWNQNEYETLALSLMGKEPSGDFEEYERLFLGWSKVYTNPAKSLQMLEQVIEARDRSWPIATLFRAHAEAHVAIDSGNLELALLAVEHATEADNALESNPFSKSINAWARIMVMPFIRETDPEKYNEIRDECKHLVEALQGHETAVQAAGLICMFFDMTEDPRTEQTFAQLTAEDWWGACRAAYFFRLGKLDTATALEPNDIEFRPFAAIVKLAISAMQGNDDVAMEGYEKIKASHSSSYVRAFAVQIPLIAGESEIASRDATRWLSDGDVPNLPFFFARTRLEYCARPSTQEAMLQEVQGYRLGQCYAHYAIAVSHFQSDPQLAGHHFRECLRTNLFWSPEYYMAKAFLAQRPELERRDEQSIPPNSFE